MYLSAIELKIINAYDKENKCLKTKCKKEYNAYTSFIENLYKNKKIKMTKEMRLNNIEMENLLKCEVEQCKQVAGDLIKKLIIGLNEDIEKYTVILNKTTNNNDKKNYKDIVKYNSQKVKILKKIDVSRISWKDLLKIQN